MTEEAIALYRLCFTEDSDAVCDVVFSQRLAQAEQRDLFSDGRLVSVLWLVKKKMYFCGEVLPVPHVVGLCTHPDYRGRGFATELIRRTVSSLPGVPFLTLYPFSHEFYKRLGFATVSFDDDPPDRAEKVSAPTDLLADLYRDFCAGADYYYIRNKADFDFYRAVNAPYGEGYALLDGGRKGFSSPDEYIPRAFSDLRGDKKGVMARICDLQAALRLIEKVPDGDTIVDPLGVCDGKVLRRTSDESLPEKTASAIDVADLTKAIFSNKRGYLADRY